MDAEAALIVIPRADSCSSKSKTRAAPAKSLDIIPAPAIRLSDKVVFPWSMCAAIHKLRICGSIFITSVAFLILSSFRPMYSPLLVVDSHQKGVLKQLASKQRTALTVNRKQYAVLLVLRCNSNQSTSRFFGQPHILPTGINKLVSALECNMDKNRII